MKKIILCMALWAMTLLGGVAQAQELSDNPIDQAFAADLNTGRSTYELAIFNLICESGQDFGGRKVV